MQSEEPMSAAAKVMFWTGWVVSVLPALMLIMSACFKLVMPAYKPEGAPDLQWDPSIMRPLGVVELTCTLIYLFPRTAVLGAILLTGYLGGAVAAHVRIFDDFYMPIILGVMVWGGLYLREPGLRPLVPWRN